MTDLQALYAGICAQPDEDTPRLALADFLDEEGGKENAFRADFIRTHIRLTRAEPYSPESREVFPHWVKLHDAAMALARERRLPWVAHLKGRTHAWFFERGLVGELRLFAKRFVADGASYFEQDPIRAIRFIGLRPGSQGAIAAESLFECEPLTRLAKLDIDGASLSAADLALLGKSPKLPQLRALSLGKEQQFTSAAVPKLLKALPKLSELSFRENDDFNDDYLSELVKGKEFKRITSLDLSGCSAIGPYGIDKLASSKNVTSLTALRFAEVGEYDDIGGGYTSPECDPEEGQEIAAILAGAKSLRNLKELNLRHRSIGDDAVKVLAGAAKALPALLRLDVSGCELTMEGVKALAESELGQRLLYVGLAYSPALSKHKKKLKEMFPNAHVAEPL